MKTTEPQPELKLCMVLKDHGIIILVCDLGCTIQESGEPSEHAHDAGKAPPTLSSHWSPIQS